MARKYLRVGPGLAIAFVLLATASCGGRHEGAGTVDPTRVPPALVAGRRSSQQAAVDALVDDGSLPSDPHGVILFGDLDVHSKLSGDALWRSLPFVTGDGVGSAADACDFARFCADLDFWALTDHAETLSPLHWKESADVMRACSAAGGDAGTPDSVAFLGWEWTQDGGASGRQFGHRAVLLGDVGDKQIPARPVSAPNAALQALREPETFWQQLRLPLADFTHAQRYRDFSRYREELRDIPRCPAGRDVHDLPADCQEVAEAPAPLLERLAQWHMPSLVVHQGSTHGSTRAQQEVTVAVDDPAQPALFEIYSGLGNAEEYRPWRAATERDERLECPPATEAYLPCCWQAGELMRRACGSLEASVCDQRVRAAQQAYLAPGLGAEGDDAERWLDCGQCRDCFNPAFMYRPDGSAQYLLAQRDFADPAQPRRPWLGFVAGSGTHRGRPGTGYKEVQRLRMTDAAAPRDTNWRARLTSDDATVMAGLWGDDPDRASSFFRTGGLAAVHAEARSRAAIWAALERREVYATSGERILLWFDLINGPSGAVPMGSRVVLNDNPRFRVRAIGAPVQLVGCPAATGTTIGAARLEQLCGGECFNPSAERRVISRIEIVRVRPQQYAGEPVDALIEDPWRRFPCPGDPSGCVIELDDPELIASGRDAIYYVRAIQEPTMAINANGLRCTGDDGRCDAIHPCYADDRTPMHDDCLAPNEERAWSSPIYVDVERGAVDDAR